MPSTADERGPGQRGAPAASLPAMTQGTGMRQSKLQPVHGYCAVVSALGLGLLAHLLTADGAQPAVFSWRFAFFAVFVIFGELYPLRVPRGDAESAVTTSTTFAFALLLSFGTDTAVFVFALASAIGDAVHRTAWWKLLFNLAQYTLALTACGNVLGMLTDMDAGGAQQFTAWNLVVLMAAGGVFFMVNVGVTAVAVAMVQRLPLLTFLRRDLAFHASSTGVLIAISPIVVVVAEHSLVLLPLILLPMLVAYRTARMSLEKEHQAFHDALTGLPNRTLFYDRAQQAILAARRNRQATALLLIDLDRFKEVNDTLGHHIGDLLLKEVGLRLQSVLRTTDTVARLGGDEFGLVLRTVTDPIEIDQIVDRIVSALERPFSVDNLGLDIEASIGIAIYPDHGEDAETLMQRADVAMYVAKSNHSGHATYAANLDHYSPDRLNLVGELRQALHQGRLVVHYQPKVSLRPRAVEGAEALVRWDHPQRGRINPDEFIPLAEQTGLIKPLTLFVLEQALRQCQAWHQAGHRIGVAVNLSARMLQDAQLPQDVARLLEACAVEARWLNLELTESSIMADPPRAMEVLTRLDAMGVKLSIDDFGTGYSSLAYLKRLPVHEIKIDKSFILNMTTDDNDAVIVRSTIDLGRNLGLRVVAEGVEKAEVLDNLAAMGCDLVQGYFISPPAPGDAVTRWLADFRQRQSQADAAVARQALERASASFD
jgi:diguanylate cyclase (GGDEF)-like protein